MPSSDIADQIRAAIRRLTWATIALFLALAFVGWLGYRNSSNDRHALQRAEARTTTALCSLRHDLKERVRSSEAFLAKHPHGFAGISAATIRTSLIGQQRTIKALSSLAC